MLQHLAYAEPDDISRRVMNYAINLVGADVALHIDPERRPTFAKITQDISDNLKISREMINFLTNGKFSRHIDYYGGDPLLAYAHHVAQDGNHKTDLDQLIQSVIESLAPAFKKKQITYHYAKTSLTPWVHRLHLRHILHNLLDNTIKYGKRNSDVVLKYANRTSESVITIKSTGIPLGGDAIEFPQLVFQNGARFPAKEENDGKPIPGQGIGLYSAFHLARIMQCDLRISYQHHSNWADYTFIVAFPKWVLVGPTNTTNKD